MQFSLVQLQTCVSSQSESLLLFTCPLQHLEVPLLKPRVNMMVSGVSGGSEQRIRDLFEQAAVRLFVACVTCCGILVTINGTGVGKRPDLYDKTRGTMTHKRFRRCVSLFLVFCCVSECISLDLFLFCQPHQQLFTQSLVTINSVAIAVQYFNEFSFILTVLLK